MLNTLYTRRSVITGSAVFGGLALLSACANGTATQKASETATETTSADAATENGTFTIGLTYTPNVQFAPFYMAYNDGEYVSNLELRHHGSQEGLFDALLAGTEHLVISGADEAAVAASNGSELVIVGGFYQQYPVEIIVPEDSDINELVDLQGKTVGVPGHYGENWYATLLALETAGLTEDDVDIQEIGYTQQSALMTSKVDAIVGYANNDAVQLEQAEFPVRGLQASAENPLIGASLITTRSVLESRSEEVQAAVQASILGMSSFMEDPDGAVAATAEYVPDLNDAEQAANAREVAVATAGLMESTDSTVGEISVEGVSEMLVFLQEHDFLGETEISAEEICEPLV